MSIDTATKPTAPSSSRFKGVRPLARTVGVGLVGLLFSVVAAVYADAIFPAQPPVPLLDPPAVAAVPEPTSGQETVQHAGAVLQADGTPSIPIIGPALDGTNGTKALRATPAGTRWSGDAQWEHAIGPMQFLPGTWLTWGRTLHARTPDPNNIDDAALAAAAYLCATGRDLTTAAGWRSAVGSCNAPDAYAASVTDAGSRYARPAWPEPPPPSDRPWPGTK